MRDTTVDGAAVVVGVDGSAPSWAALDWAADEVAASGGRLVVCHVQSGDQLIPVRSVAGVSTAGDRLADELLEQALGVAYQHLGPSQLATARRHGTAGQTLTTTAEPARMLVVGTHGRIGMAAHLAGSTALYCATHASCPAAIVRPLMTSSAGPFVGHVVIGVDGSPAAEAALEFGFGYAASHELPVAAVHVSQDWPGDFWYHDKDTRTTVAGEPEGQRLLGRETAAWERKYPDVLVKRAVFGGNPVPALLRAAGRARLLVIGNRSRDAGRQLVLGSVTRGVVSNAGCPIAVTRRAGPGNTS